MNSFRVCIIPEYLKLSLKTCFLHAYKFFLSVSPHHAVTATFAAVTLHLPTSACSDFFVIKSVSLDFLPLYYSFWKHCNVPAIQFTLGN